MVRRRHPVRLRDEAHNPTNTVGRSVDVAQMAERNLAKVEATGSIPVIRSRSGTQGITMRPPAPGLHPAVEPDQVVGMEVPPAPSRHDNQARFRFPDVFALWCNWQHDGL